MENERDEILQSLRQLKESMPGVGSLGLFGSFARNEAGPFSDIDVAIKLQGDYLEKNDAWDYFELFATIQNSLGKKFEKKVDVFDLDSASRISEKIKREILYV